MPPPLTLCSEMQEGQASAPVPGLVPFGFWACPVSRKHPCRGRRQGFSRAALSYLRGSVTGMVSRPAPPRLHSGPGAAGQISWKLPQAPGGGPFSASGYLGCWTGVGARI